MPTLMYDAVLNGVSLSSLADEIILRDIVEEPPTEDRQTEKRALHAGSRHVSCVRRSLPVRLVYCIRAYDGERRAEIADLIAAWAGKGGELTISTRPGKRLFVRPDGSPRLGSSLKWTEDISLTLTAWEQPYWESATPDAQISIKEADLELQDSGYYHYWGDLQAKGTVDHVPVSFWLMNISEEAPLTYLKIRAGDTFIELVDLNVEATYHNEVTGAYYSGGQLSLDYSEQDVQSITYGNGYSGASGSALANRTAESNDDLLAACGDYTVIEIWTDVPVLMEVYTRGRWL